VAAEIGDDFIIFDAGTGLRLLGNHLLSRPKRPRIHLFISHVHWDHIQGFPFFAPAYTAGFEIRVYGRGQADNTLGQILAGQMEGPNFPVSLDQLAAKISYRDLSAGDKLDLQAQDGTPLASVHCVAGHHPNGVLMYRLQESAKGKSMVYATDTEHYEGRLDLDLARLAQGADVLIYDGMYTPEEYEKNHKGWGHSTWEQGLAIVKKAEVRHLVVFHHDPSHDDEFLDKLHRDIRRTAQSEMPGVSVSMAIEGQTIELD